MNIYNFFKFLEEKEGRVIPLGLKIKDPNFQITQKEVDKYGNLDLSYTPITSLPSGLKIGGNISLQGTKITSLPSDLEVRGNLDLSLTPISSLPSGLKIGGTLYLSNTSISSLPSGLEVGSLNLSNTSISSLPSDLKVKDDLFIFSTPLAQNYTKKEIKQMAPNVKGEIKGGIKLRNK